MVLCRYYKRARCYLLERGCLPFLKCLKMEIHVLGCDDICDERGVLIEVIKKTKITKKGEFATSFLGL